VLPRDDFFTQREAHHPRTNNKNNRNNQLVEAKASHTNQRESMAEVIVKEDAVEGVKEAPVKSPAAKTPPPSNATHTTAAGEETVAAGSPPGRGLSELARQLRVMQAKNQALTVEVGRLERQLRILSDLSGISVTDLRATLERACESEAYGELQHRLAKLQAQLEEAKLKQRNSTETFDREADAKRRPICSCVLGS
jgi:hypothetical protein